MTKDEALTMALEAMKKGKLWSRGWMTQKEFNTAIAAIEEALAQQDKDYDALSQKQLASIKRDTRISLEDAAVRTIHKMAEPEQNNFCPRCGKRRGGDVNYIHTCTPPARGTMAHYTPRTFDDYGNKIV